MKGGVEVYDNGKDQLSRNWREFLNLRAGGIAVLATLLSPLLADAAVEAFLSGSPRQFQLKSIAWWRDSRWRRRFVVTAGGLMMVFGGFGLAFVVIPASIKLLVGGALPYALARLT